MTQAFHFTATGSPCGHIIRLEDGTTLHHAGDTGIFESMKTFGEFCPIDVTMHFKTFPILVQDPSGFLDLTRKEAPNVEIIQLNPGEEYIYLK